MIRKTIMLILFVCLLCIGTVTAVNEPYGTFLQAGNFMDLESTFHLGAENLSTTSFAQNKLTNTLQYGGNTYAVIFDSGKIRLVDENLQVFDESPASKSWVALDGYHVEQVNNTLAYISFTFYNISAGYDAFTRIRYDGNFEQQCQALFGSSLVNKGVRCDDDFCYSISNIYYLTVHNKTTCGAINTHKATYDGQSYAYEGLNILSWAVDYDQDGNREMIVPLNETRINQSGTGHMEINGSFYIYEILDNGSVTGDDNLEYFRYYTYRYGGSTANICSDTMENDIFPMCYFGQYDDVGDYEIVCGRNFRCTNRTLGQDREYVASVTAVLNSDGSPIHVEYLNVSNDGTSIAKKSFSIPVLTELDVATQENDICWVEVAARRTAMYNISYVCRAPDNTRTRYFTQPYVSALFDIRFMYISDFNDNNLNDLVSPIGILYDVVEKDNDAYSDYNVTFNWSFSPLATDMFAILDIDGDNYMDILATSDPQGTELYKAQIGGGYTPAANCTELVQTVKFFTGNPICLDESVVYRAVTNRCVQYQMYVDCYGDGTVIETASAAYDPFVTCTMNKTGIGNAQVYVYKVGQALDDAPYYSVHQVRVLDDAPPACYLTNDYNVDATNNISNVRTEDPTLGTPEDAIGGIFTGLGFQSATARLFLAMLILIMTAIMVYMGVKSVTITIIATLFAFIGCLILGLIPLWVLFAAIIGFAVYAFIRAFSSGGDT